MNEKKSQSTVSSPDASNGQPQVTDGVPRRSNKGLIALLVTLGVLGLAALIGLIVYFTTFYISKSDYQHAAAETNKTIDEYNKTIEAADQYAATVEDSKSTDAQVQEDANAYKNAYNAYVGHTKTLANERAMKNDKVKAAYDAFASKNAAFTSAYSAMEATMGTMRKVAVNCDNSSVGSMDTDDLSKLTESYDKALTPCVNAMKELAGSKNENTAKEGKQAVAFFDELRTHVVAMQSAYAANDRTKFESEYNTFMEKSNTFDSASDLRELRKYQNKISPDKELNNLAQVIDSHR